MKKVFFISIISILLTSATQIEINREDIVGTWKIQEAKNNSGSVADSSMFMDQYFIYLDNGLGIFYHPNSPISVADTGYWEVVNNAFYILDLDSVREKQNVLELNSNKMVILHEYEESSTTITYKKQKNDAVIK